MNINLDTNIFIEKSFINNKFILNSTIDNITKNDFTLNQINDLPNSLFKFYNNTTNKENINYSKQFIDNCVYLANPLDFNDPFDCQLNLDKKQFCISILLDYAKALELDIDSQTYELNKIIFDFSNQLYPIFIDEIKLKTLENKINDSEELIRLKLSLFITRLQCYLNVNKSDINAWQLAFTETLNDIYGDTLETISNNFRIACFTTNIDNILMWSHYANNHTGFCVEYDLSSVKKIATTNINSLTKSCKKILLNLMPIIYTTQRKDITQSLNKLNLNTIQENTLWDIYRYGALSKYMTWMYENEWRLVLDKTSFHNKALFFPIKAIYLGCKINKTEQQYFIDLIRKHNKSHNTKINIYDSSMSTNDYSLIHNKII